MAQQRYLQLSPDGSGNQREQLTVEVSSGSADGSKIPNTRADGTLDPTLLGAVATGGASNAGKVVKLDDDGKLDSAMLPPGSGTGAPAETATIVASEALQAGCYVNEHISGSNFRVRKADASLGREAHGYVIANVVQGGTATVYYDGINDALSNRTFGAQQFLGTGGLAVETPSTTAGHILQTLGIALSATSAKFRPGVTITLA